MYSFSAASRAKRRREQQCIITLYIHGREPKKFYGKEEMEHVAVMRKSWGLTHKILSGQKTIESRWYSKKHRPWDRIAEGETVYFKDSGEPVSLKAEVRKVLQVAGLTPQRVRELLEEYGEDDGLEKENGSAFFERFKNKKYCMFIFLQNPQKVEPFVIDKTGFGAMASWITVDDVARIMKKYEGASD